MKHCWKRFKALVVIAAVPFVLSSCSSERLHDMTIVQAVGLDNGKEITATIQYLDLNRTAGSTEALEGNITAVQSDSAATINAALVSANKTLAGDDFYGQNKLFVLGKSYAESGLDDFVNYLVNSRDSRPDVLVAMSDGTAEDVLNSEASGARVPAENMVDLLNNGEKYATAPAVTVNDVINLYFDPACDVFLPIFSADEKSVYPGGIALFSKEKYVGRLTGRDVLGFMLAAGRAERGILNIEKNGESVSLDIISAKVKRRVEVNGGRIAFIADMKVKLTVNEGSGAGSKEELAEQAERTLKAAVKSAVNECLSHKSDALQISRMAARSNEEFYYANEDNWRSLLENIEVVCNVSAVIE